MSPTSITVLSMRVVFLSNRSLMMLRAGSIGTEVNKADIIGTETFSRFQFDLPGLFHKVLGAGDVVWGLANQWFEDFWQAPWPHHR